MNERIRDSTAFFFPLVLISYFNSPLDNTPLYLYHYTPPLLSTASQEVLNPVAFKSLLASLKDKPEKYKIIAKALS
ncbi:hypothetical protein [Ferroglobus sp.]|uniref:hypothetical protein n=1 Tax=Ferroglobus sp. TaxID=2614230 RepID=UPI0025C2A518|nr:hypothetical protein [Ferroglobus sp.]